MMPKPSAKTAAKINCPVLNIFPIFTQSYYLIERGALNIMDCVENYFFVCSNANLTKIRAPKKKKRLKNENGLVFFTNRKSLDQVALYFPKKN